MRREGDYGGKQRSKESGEVDWARIWFSKLAKFHNVEKPHEWRFTQQDVIDFLVAQKAGHEGVSAQVPG